MILLNVFIFGGNRNSTKGTAGSYHTALEGAKGMQRKVLGGRASGGITFSPFWLYQVRTRIIRLSSLPSLFHRVNLRIHLTPFIWASKTFGTAIYGTELTRHKWHNNLQLTCVLKGDTRDVTYVSIGSVLIPQESILYLWRVEFGHWGNERWFVPCVNCERLIDKTNAIGRSVQGIG